MILACGGDGTAAWIFSVLDTLDFDNPPAVGILPLGTGNDLARVLGWGAGYDFKEFKRCIESIGTAHQIAYLDRWQLTISNEATSHTESKIVNNYFSVGIDAKVALKFHEQRTDHPAQFNNQLVNKFWYLKHGTTSISDGCIGFKNYVTLWVDNQKIDLPDDLQGIIAVNIPSAYGGAYLWMSHHALNTQNNTPNTNQQAFRAQAIDDGLIEICGLKGSVHLGQIQSGIASAVYLGQGKDIVILVNETFAAQIDGEPWEQPSETKYSISSFKRVPVIILPKNSHSSLSQTARHTIIHSNI